ncbi:MAG: radical SAM family heme chaperone HemW, partial [Bacteroidota bacterium]|nr:radical SAM family heme chaperone HemW [Bacteroidota bacterium]
MAGIYIHIPFCKQKCHYCNFYSLASIKYIDDVVKAIGKELVLAKNYLQTKSVSTIYFGGGTPSLLSLKHLEYIFGVIEKNYIVDADAEITLEANPDDLNKEKIKGLLKTPINRLSIGVQSFYDEELKYLNRSHSSKTAQNVIHRVRDAGIENLTIDLIYGIPVSTDESWRSNLQMCFDMKIPHISCYALTVEPNTALDVFIRNKKMKPVSDEKIINQFNILTAAIKKQGYQQYEISNFCRDKQYAKHNTGYWFGEPYLGVGPSAHSYNTISRRWNIANIISYLSSIEKGDIPFDEEVLDEKQRYDEYIMTRLRTQWGVALQALQND